MKKIIFSLIFVFVSSVCFAQIDISEAVSLLGNPVPKGFSPSGGNVNSNVYTKDNYDAVYILFVRNNNTVLISIGDLFDTVSGAFSWREQIFGIMLAQNWTLFEEYTYNVVYQKNDVFLIISLPYRRDDGWIAMGVQITRNLELIILE
jgi:hypothetical protein